MNRKSGFTLMELLLVVAVLAIVAAAAAPTFFGGAADAMKEARRSSVSSAYANLMSQAGMSASVQMARGDAVSTTPGVTTNWPAPITGIAHPDPTKDPITLTATWNDTSKKVIIAATVGASNGDIGAYPGGVSAWIKSLNTPTTP